MTTQREKKNVRCELIDGIRGLAIVNMVMFHFLFDWHEIFLGDTGWYWMPPVRVWQQFICRTFILVSGFVWEWGKEKNLRRGLFLNFCGCGISLVMWLFLPEEAIWFGILNFYGCAVLLTIPAEKALRAVPPVAGIALSYLLFCLTRHASRGYLGSGGHPLAKLPGFLYSWKPMAILGFPWPGFVSSDYYPLIPWYFLFLCGFWLQQMFRRRTACPDTGRNGAGNLLQRIVRCRVPFLSAVGKKSIWIYLLHQPVCYAAAGLLFRLRG